MDTDAKFHIHCNSVHPGLYLPTRSSALAILADQITGACSNVACLLRQIRCAKAKQKICSFSLLLGSNVRWPLLVALMSQDEYADGTDEPTDRRTDAASVSNSDITYIFAYDIAWSSTQLPL